MIRRLSTTIFILLFLGAMFGGLFHMSMGMDMTGNMTGCPYMSSNEELCNMSVSDHAQAWKDSFTATVPTFLTFLAALVAIAVTISIAPNLAIPQKLLHVRLKVLNIVERSFSYFIRPLQELFSSGILHPKLF